MNTFTPHTKYPCELAFHSACELGESPIWDAAQERLLWVDISKGHLHWLAPATQKHGLIDVGEWIGSIALTSDGNIIAALASGFAFIALETAKIDRISDPEAGLKNNRFNDGKCDPSGRFWAGTMSTSGKKEAGSVYAIGPDLMVSKKITKVTTANGMAWCPTGEIFYFIDTPTKRIAAYRFDALTGNIHGKRTVVRIPPAMGYPDGMTIDCNGMLWVAMWDGWSVARWNPQTGKLLALIDVPVKRPTSCCFGGNNLSELYITTASYGLSDEELKAQPNAGGIFIISNTGTMGLPASKFTL